MYSIALLVSMAHAYVRVAVHTDRALFTTAKEYVSFNIDACQWRGLDLTDDTLVALAAAFSPAHLRVGGTQQDYDVYAVGTYENFSCEHDILPPMTVQPLPDLCLYLLCFSTSVRASPQDYRCKTVSGDQFSGLLRFATAANLTLVFGLNDMFGRPTKSKSAGNAGHEEGMCNETHGCPPRNQSNLEAFLQWTKENHPEAPIYAWELGNELNTVLNDREGARTQAGDFVALAALRDQLWPHVRLIGPDTHSSAEFSDKGLSWFEGYVEASKGHVDAYTFHMYSMGNGKKLDPSKLAASFLNATALDKSGRGGQVLADILHRQHTPGALWAGETASANNGGQSGITDTFIDGFWYIDQLGSLPTVNVSVFQRQVFAGSGYPLVSISKGPAPSYMVLPDYWVGLLFKQLMGDRVLQVHSPTESVRAYAHCGRDGGVAIAWLNIGSSAAEVEFGLGGKGRIWTLTAGQMIPSGVNPLQSKETLLNGELLQLKGKRVPELKGKLLQGDSPIMLPATSYGYVTFSADAAGCA